jgi:hypothetical protein
MSRLGIVAIDLVAISILVFGLYFPRYRRRDMVVAYLALNAGVLLVAMALSSNTTIGTNFGLGLFGALSIIRLRSSELSHEEVAYYFASLALGLFGGIEVDTTWMEFALPGAIIVVMFIGDHQRLFAGARHQIITLDRAIVNEDELVRVLSTLLDARIDRVMSRKVDLVDDITVVDVRYRVTPSTRPSRRGRRHTVTVS